MATKKVVTKNPPKTNVTPTNTTQVFSYAQALQSNIPTSSNKSTEVKTNITKLNQTAPSTVTEPSRNNRKGINRSKPNDIQFHTGPRLSIPKSVQNEWSSSNTTKKPKMVKGPVQSLQTLCRIKVLSEISYRDQLDEVYREFPGVFRLFYEKQVLPDPFKINDLVLLYLAVPLLRKKLSIWNIYNKIETFERVYLAKSKGLPVPGDIKVTPKGPMEDPLIDVWNNYDTFILESLSDNEKMDKIYFSDHPPFRPRNFDSDSVPYSIANESNFKKRFNLFTNNQFSGWKGWDNMVVVGGSVSACMLHIPSKYSQSAQMAARFYHDIAYRSSDIDIYIYGVTAEQFSKKVIDLHAHLQSIHRREVIVVKTPYTITFCTEYPNRHIQIVIGKWNSIAEVLLEADIDCSCVGYDGNRLWATQRARLSYNFKWIRSSPHQYSVRSFPEYEARLVKYSMRGFHIIDENLVWSKISNTYIQYAYIRLKEHKTIEGRTGVCGLRLLLTAVVHPNIKEYISLFHKPNYKTSGLVYGPQFKLLDLKKNLDKKIIEETTYGPYEIESPYKRVEDLNFDLVIKDLESLDPDSLKSRRRRYYTWYSRIFKADQIEEDKLQWKSRLDFGSSFKLVVDSNRMLEIHTGKYYSRGDNVSIIKNELKEPPHVCMILEKNPNIIKELLAIVEPYIRKCKLSIDKPYKFYHT
eukprot:TRINITY_DN1303_c0_g1_i1.p1 TRINITY_DN1303_c0_g1~~TRINITY_DN1303_c0_g1_i1.p1  ORF type:complete len:692 (+),score=71.79 TRINITY_DN1303_c0_g1_i1:1857-3932(+)